MSTLKRHDGTEFVLHAYRELIKNGNKAETTQKIRALSNQHGRFARLFKKENGAYEGVFSTESGYLLGESVKHYFYQTQNLIFCEEYNKTHLLVVVVQQGIVRLDTIIPKSKLPKALHAFIEDAYQYQIFTNGDVPLRRQDSFFPKEKAINFEKISNPLLPRLPTMKSLTLLPLPEAIKAQHLQNHSSSLIYIAITAVALTAGGIILDTINKSQHQYVNIGTPSVLNLYQAYQSALRSPKAESTLHNLMQTIVTLYTLPGWKAASIELSQNRYRVFLQADGGSLMELMQWCNDNHYTLHLNETTPFLERPFSLPDRNHLNAINNVHGTLNNIMNQLNPLLGSEDMLIGNTQIFSASKQIPITLTIQTATPKILDIIGQLIQNQPLVINSARFKLNDITISGQIQLSLWGS